MTAYAGAIDKTEGSANGTRFSVLIDSTGCTAGDTLKYDGSTARTANICTAKTDVFIGVAAQTKTSGQVVEVLGSGCLVRVPVGSLTLGAYVQPEHSGTGGWEDYTDGTKAGIVVRTESAYAYIRVI